MDRKLDNEFIVINRKRFQELKKSETGRQATEMFLEALGDWENEVYS